MMVLRMLLAGPANRYEIARAIERLSDDVLDVDHGSLYPALYCLEKNALVVCQMQTVVHKSPRTLLSADRSRQEAAHEYAGPSLVSR